MAAYQSDVKWMCALLVHLEQYEHPMAASWLDRNNAGTVHGHVSAQSRGKREMGGLWGQKGRTRQWRVSDGAGGCSECQ